MSACKMDIDFKRKIFKYKLKIQLFNEFLCSTNFIYLRISSPKSKFHTNAICWNIQTVRNGTARFIAP